MVRRHGEAVGMSSVKGQYAEHVQHGVQVEQTITFVAPEPARKHGLAWIANAAVSCTCACFPSVMLIHVHTRCTGSLARLKNGMACASI